MLNEIIHSGRRPERGKSVTYSGSELSSSNDKPFDFGNLASSSSNGVNNYVIPVSVVVSAGSSIVGNPLLNSQATVNSPSASQTSQPSLNVNPPPQTHTIKIPYL